MRRRSKSEKRAGEPGGRDEGAELFDQDEPDEPDDRVDPAVRRRRLTRSVLAGAAAIVVGLVAVVAVTRSDPDPPPPDLPVDAWAPYWALDASVPDLSRRAGTIRELSPFWYQALGAGTIQMDPNTPADLAEELLRVARRSGMAVVPAIVDVMPAGGMAAVLADPATRTIHVNTIVRLAEEQGYDGIDIDYEQFAFADGRSTWFETRPNWVAFVTELAERLHADGRTLTVSIPPVFDEGRTEASGYWVYDYAAIAPVVDRIRVMAYDFSTSAPGPIAPLEWVEMVARATRRVSGTPEKLVLGIPLYGYNWPAGDTGDCPTAEMVGRTTVTIRSVGDLVELRDAVPVYDDTTGEWAFVYDLEVSDGTRSCVQARRVHYVGPEGALARMDIARRAGFGGVALWALGYDDQELWDTIEPLLRPPDQPAD